MKYVGGGGNAMVPHMSGTTLDAQARYATGVKNILERFFAGHAQIPSDVIVEGGHYATKYLRHRVYLTCRAYGIRK
jgi:formate dehydrogenase